MAVLTKGDLFAKCYKHRQPILSFVRSIVKRKYPVKPDDTEDKLIPEMVYTFSKDPAATLQMYVWGLGEHGGLGILRQMKDKRSSRVPRFLPRPSRLSFAEQHKVTDVACGYGFTLLAVKSKSTVKVYGTGINTDSQLGYQAQRSNAPMGLILSPAPVELPLSSISRIAGLAAGRAHSLVLVDDGDRGGTKCFALGNNAYGQCARRIVEGENYTGSQRIQCIKHLNNSPIKFINCGQDHSIFVNTKGEVFACGWGADGQTGLGHYQSTSTPTQLKGDIEGENIIHVATYGDCNLALNDKGDLFGWGNSEYGQLLQDDASQLHTPRHLQIPEIGPVIDAVTAGAFCAVLNSRGEVWVWGFGLLGLGPEVTRTKQPKQIPPPLLGHNALAHPGHCITGLSCGLFHLAALSSHGDLYTWGRNKDGCLGLGQSNDQPFPLRVSIGAHVLKASCGVDHMAVICKSFSRC